MQVTHKINIHFDDQRRMPPIDVMQGDAYTRQMEFSLYSGGEKWTVPEGVSVAVAYYGASGHGAYDTLPDGSKAYIVDGSTVTVTLIPQVTAVHGKTTISVVFTDDTGKQLATFGVELRVAPNPAVGAGEPANYYNLREWASTPFRIYLIQNSEGIWAADESYDTIRQEQEAGRQLLCCIETDDQQWLELPLTQDAADALTFSAIIGGAEWVATITRGEDGAAVVTVTESAVGQPTLYVTLVGIDPIISSVPFADIVSAHQGGREVIVQIQEYRLRLSYISDAGAVFQCANANSYVRLTIYSDGTTKYSMDYCAKLSDLDSKMGVPIATDEKYFGITDDGMIYLLPEYRGASPSSAFSYSVSDNGLGVAGSKNTELPEEIVIPEIVSEIPVTAYAEGMFLKNLRVRRLALLEAVKTIPKTFCAYCYNLTEVLGTETVETLMQSAFNTSGIVKANFPNLKQFDGGNQFAYCWKLAVADIGNTVDAIPTYCFCGCERLTVIRNAENVTSVGDFGLFFAKRLITPSFIGNLNKIGNYGLLLSRPDYEWDSLTDCETGERATAKYVNATDFWSGCTTAPCNTPMRSTFNQNNPLWADKTVGGNITRKWASACGYVSAAMVYSALMGVDMDSPEEFTEIVRTANPELMDEPSDDISDDNDYFVGMEEWLTAVGLTVDRRTAYTAENLQAMYDALANGALVITRCLGDYVGSNHAFVIHGVNTKGEVFITDPKSTSMMAGVYEAGEYVMPIQNFARGSEDYFVIVTKED